jgi:hypothetical protein
MDDEQVVRKAVIEKKRTQTSPQLEQGALYDVLIYYVNPLPWRLHRTEV